MNIRRDIDATLAHRVAAWRTRLPDPCALVLAMLAIAVPIVAALWLAQREALSRETDRLLDYTQESLSRSEQTAKEISQVGNTLAEMPGGPCSAAHLAQMRRFATQLTYVKAVGYVSGTNLVCSSLGDDGKAQDLGPAEWGGPHGIDMRTNVRFAFDRSTAYLVAQFRNHAVVIDGNLALPAYTGRPGTLTALYAWHTGDIIAERRRRSALPQSWLRRFANESQLPTQRFTTVHDGDYLVTVSYSANFRVAALAALPFAHVEEQARRQALWFAPLGMLISALLLLLIRYVLRQQRSIEAAIRRGIRRREFHLVYQPIVALDTEQWIGAEALLRWTDSEGVSHRPDVFIPAAERAGVMSELTAHIFDLLTHELAGVFARYPRLAISFNVSSQDVAEPDRLLANLTRLQQATGAGPHNLKIELTEHSLVAREPATRLLHQARAMGICVAIDDFGIGYSGLAHLENFEIDALKIDKLFIDTMRGDAPTSQVALHIIQLAQALKLRTIAEGVETREQVQFLRELGVHFAQGWFYSHAIDFGQFIHFYAGLKPSAVEHAAREVAA
jgi:sensor c-di-GMP phosphodiesterase-like protein